MTISSGFFNSVSNDRLYDAESFNTLIGSLITDGVLSTVGGTLMVTANGTNLTVTVASGRAWFNNSWLDSDTDEQFILDAADPSNDRIDVVALDFHTHDSARQNGIVVLKGTPNVNPVPPTLLDDDVNKHWQYPLAHVLVQAATTSISQANITNKVGSSETPLATGTVQQLSTDDLVAQWDDDFNTWYDSMKDQLSQDAAGNLQLQIDELNPIRFSYRNLIINGDNQVAQRTSGLYSGTGNFSGYLAISDRWYCTADMGANALSFLKWVKKDHTEEKRNWLRIKATATATLGSMDFFLLRQSIENVFLSELRKGTTEAKKLSLSFSVEASVPGLYVVDIQDIENNRIVAATYTIDAANTPQRINVTFSADSLGELPLDTNAGLDLRFWLLAGSGRQVQDIDGLWKAYAGSDAKGQVNAMGSVDDYWMVTDVQLEVSDEVTEFERIPYDQQLLRCQRYYEIVENTLRPTACWYGKVYATLYMVASKRVTSYTITENSPGVFINVAVETPTSIEYTNKRKSSFQVRYAHPDVVTYSSYMISGSFEIDAEL